MQNNYFFVILLELVVAISSSNAQNLDYIKFMAKVNNNPFKSYVYIDDTHSLKNKSINLNLQNNRLIRELYVGVKGSAIKHNLKPISTYNNINLNNTKIKLLKQITKID